MPKYFYLIFLIFLNSCAGAPPETSNPVSQEVMKNYFAQIKKFDGIDEHEAVLLAQSQLLFQGLDNDYYYDRPRIEAEDDHSFQISFDPINRTLAENQTHSPIEVVVSKKDGSVRLIK